MQNYPVTPPGETNNVSSTASTVLRAQADSLNYLATLYESEHEVQEQFSFCLQKMYNSVTSNGKIIFSGMGKSFKIAEKLVATMNSLGIHAASLHPSEALHGDLGLVKSLDTLVVISASGNSPELHILLDHLAKWQSVICLTCTPDSELSKRSNGVLMAYVPDKLKETNVYGLSAPTVSTTACLAVGDAVCISLCEMLFTNKREREQLFGRNHPGGVIGQSYSNGNAAEARNESDKPSYTVESVVLYYNNLMFADELDLLRKCIGKEWLLCYDGEISQEILQRGVLYSVDDIANAISSGKNLSSVKGFSAPTLRMIYVGFDDPSFPDGRDDPVLVIDGNKVVGVVKR
jgi:D-arabinose 5-phosphate isomerase GutQ